jgi:hypothetical protein
MFRAIGGAMRQNAPKFVASLHTGASTAPMESINDAHRALRALCRHPERDSFNDACQSLSERTWTQAKTPNQTPETIYAFEEISRFALELARLNGNYQVGELAQHASIQNPSGNALNTSVSLAAFARPDHLQRTIDRCRDRCETHDEVKNVLSNEALKALAQFSRTGQLPEGANAHTLSAQEALCLVDYVHPTTGTFAAITMAKRAEQYGNKAATAILSPLLVPLEKAIEKLAVHPDFKGDPGTTLYKGMRLSEAGQAAMYKVTEQARHYSFGQPLSATSLLACAYGADRGNNSVWLFKGLPHAQVHAFHPEETAGQMECLVPAGAAKNLSVSRGAQPTELNEILLKLNFSRDKVFTLRSQ